jgi:hypothetical protein
MALCRSVNRINSEVASKKEQGFWHRLLSVTIDRDRIAGWEKDLDRVLLLFNVCLWDYSELLLLNDVSRPKELLESRAEWRS